MALKRMLVATDVRLRYDANGGILSTHPAASYETFGPIREVYEVVTLFAREAPLDMPSTGVAGGSGMQLSQVPDFSSVSTLFKALPRALWIAWKETGRHDIVMGRLPEPLSLLVGWVAVVRRRPFIANLVADPTASRAGGRIVARLAQRALLAATRGLVSRAAATIYVTEAYLQRVCPPPSGPALVHSDVRIDETWFLQPRRGPLTSPPRVVLVGQNHTWDKGQLVLLDAAALLAREGRTVDLTFVGGGRRLDELRDQARNRLLPGSVSVLGQIADRERLAAVLDEHDIFCLPSLSEGLPRALVEALARGLPAVGTTVGGIPELLPQDALCAPGDAVALAGALRSVMDDPFPYVRSSDGIEAARRVVRRSQPGTLVEFLRRVEHDLPEACPGR
jgi:glycosyltransferase involved in cell wall biosynthesis